MFGNIRKLTSNWIFFSLSDPISDEEFQPVTLIKRQNRAENESNQVEVCQGLMKVWSGSGSNLISLLSTARDDPAGAILFNLDAEDPH